MSARPFPNNTGSADPGVDTRIESEWNRIIPAREPSVQPARRIMPTFKPYVYRGCGVDTLRPARG